MSSAALESACPLCGGTKRPGRTTFAADLGEALVVVRNVPATVCGQCGEEWIAADTARTLERLTEEARRKREQVAILAL